MPSSIGKTERTSTFKHAGINVNQDLLSFFIFKIFQKCILLFFGCFKYSGILIFIILISGVQYGDLTFLHLTTCDQLTNFSNHVSPCKLITIYFLVENNICQEQKNDKK